MPEKNIELFRKRINELCTLSESDKKQKIRIDVPMPMDYTNLELIRELSILEPFGKDNTKPVFADKQIAIKRMWIMGKNKNVLKLSLITASGKIVSGIYFGDIPAFMQYIEEKYGRDQLEAAIEGKENIIKLSFVYYPRVNDYRGVEELQFEIQYYQ